MRRIGPPVVLIVALLLCARADGAWLRGNLHTHTVESDGDSTPAEVVRWYREHGYDFLVITDHDKLTIADGGGLVMIPGEEVTSRLAKRHLHVNAIGIAKVVTKATGETAVGILQRNIDSIREAGGIALVNHPNFGWSFGAEELAQLERFALLEIASGHPYVNMHGPPPVEEMWDALLTAGKRVWGVAVDDMHHLKRPWDDDVALPGQAWVMVNAEKREAKAIIDALARGDFYASTGVEIAEYAVTPEKITIRVKEKNLARYRTRFIASNGRVVQESAGGEASYAIRGDEGYVRAKVIDSNGKVAWLQPTFVRSRAN
jgi:hypothetical protein